jgi:hypothetical protein
VDGVVCEALGHDVGVTAVDDVVVVADVVEQRAHGSGPIFREGGRGLSRRSLRAV